MKILSKFTIWIIPILFCFGSTSESKQALCFDPFTDATIAEFFLPNQLCRKTQGMPCVYHSVDMHESISTIASIHSKIMEAQERYKIDPRLIYYRILGESQADPFAEAWNGDGGYGMLQFTGGFISTGNHRRAIEALYRRSAGVSPRLIQIRYYVDTYLKLAVEQAKYGCKKGSDFSEYGELEKLTYLGYNACGRTAVRREIGIFNNNKSYLAAASSVLASHMDLSQPFPFAAKNPLPICETAILKAHLNRDRTPGPFWDRN